jgi:hypothetical protein
MAYDIFHEKTIEPEYGNGCYYCGKQVSNWGEPVKIFLYGKPDVTNNKRGVSCVKVPRCKSCELKHGLHMLWIFPVAIITYFAVIGLSKILGADLGIMELSILVIFFGISISMFSWKYIQPIVTGIKREDDVTKYPPAKSLLDNGSDIDGAPSGINF